VSQAKAGLLSSKKGKDGVARYYKSIGLGYRTPKEAIEGTYVDKKCPFTSDVSIRGRILKGQTTQQQAQHAAQPRVAAAAASKPTTATAANGTVAGY
jgi:hypothetical protein